MNWNIVSAITRKDVVDAIRHRYLLTALVTPLFVALMFRVMLPNMNSREILTVVVHDPAVSGIVAELQKDPRIGVVEVASADATPKEVATRKAIGGLVVPPNFASEIAAGRQPELTVYFIIKRLFSNKPHYEGCWTRRFERLPSSRIRHSWSGLILIRKRRTRSLGEPVLIKCFCLCF